MTPLTREQGRKARTVEQGAVPWLMKGTKHRRAATPLLEGPEPRGTLLGGNRANREPWPQTPEVFTTGEACGPLRLSCLAVARSPRCYTTPQKKPNTHFPPLSPSCLLPHAALRPRPLWVLQQQFPVNPQILGATSAPYRPGKNLMAHLEGPQKTGDCLPSCSPRSLPT